MKKIRTVTPYDHVAILMAIEENIYRACEPLRNMRDESGPLDTGVGRRLKKMVAELAVLQPDKILNVSIRGYCDLHDHSIIDEKVQKKFPSGLTADSEGDSIFIYCTEALKDEVLAFLNKSFKGIKLSAGKDDDPMVDGLFNWDDAQKCVKDHGLEAYVVIDDTVKAKISERYDKLIAKKKEKYEKDVAELENLKSGLQ